MSLPRPLPARSAAMAVAPGGPAETGSSLWASIRRWLADQASGRWHRRPRRAQLHGAGSTRHRFWGAARRNPSCDPVRRLPVPRKTGSLRILPLPAPAPICETACRKASWEKKRTTRLSEPVPTTFASRSRRPMTPRQAARASSSSNRLSWSSIIDDFLPERTDCHGGEHARCNAQPQRPYGRRRRRSQEQRLETSHALQVGGEGLTARRTDPRE